MDQTFFSALVLILLVTDPLGNIGIFVSLLGRVPAARRRRLILREILIAYTVLLVFMFAGQHFLDLLHLSKTSMGLAGGVILFLISLKLIFPSSEGVFGGAVGEDEPFIVPLAIPSIAGPSAMATVLMISSRDESRMAEWIAALTVAMVVQACVLGFAERISQRLGPRVVMAFERLMGLVLSAMAIEMVLSGVKAFVADLKA